MRPCDCGLRVPRWLQGEDDFEVPRLPTRGGDRETDARDRLASRDRKRSEGSLVGGGTAADDRDSRAYLRPLVHSTCFCIGVE